MKVNSPFICIEEEEAVNNIRSQGDYDLSRTVQNGSTCSCKLHDCSNNGTKCIDNPNGEPGVIQLPCLREMPTLGLCSTCCLFSYLEGICAFYRMGL